MDIDYIIICVIALAAVGIVWMVATRRRRAAMKALPRFKAYMADHPEGRLDGMSGSLGIKLNEVIADLDWLIQHGKLRGAYIDRDQQRLMLLNSKTQMPGSDGAAYVTATCPACGASVKVVKGASGKCEFCGGPING